MNETLPIPTHGWTCFFCGETFTTPGAAADHFGGELELSQPGCLIDYRVQLEEGGKPERGRGLLMALRKTQEDNEKLRRRLEEADNDTCNATIRFHNMQRKIGELLRPGRTVERMVELFHATNPEHGGLVIHCSIWPCIWIHHQHQFTSTLESNVEPALRDHCIICGRLEGDTMHQITPEAKPCFF